MGRDGGGITQMQWFLVVLPNRFRAVAGLPPNRYRPGTNRYRIGTMDGASAARIAGLAVLSLVV
jgi:hypothetical protein